MQNERPTRKSRKTKDKPSGKRKIIERIIIFNKGKSRREGVGKGQNEGDERIMKDWKL